MVRLVYTVSQKNAPTLASCSFDKRGLILIIFGKRHQRTFINDKHNSTFLSLHLYLVLLFLKVCWCCCWQKVIKISPCLKKLQLAKVGAFFLTHTVYNWASVKLQVRPRLAANTDSFNSNIYPEPYSLYARGTVLLKLATDRHEASRGLSATAERVV